MAPKHLITEPRRNARTPEHGSQQMTFRIAQPGALLEHLTGGTGDDIRPAIAGMWNGIPHPLKEGVGFLGVVREAVCDRLRLCDDGRGLPVNNGRTLQIIGQMLRLEFH
jgi:hypothetical protein